MDFVLIDEAACQQIIQDRRLLSSEFESGRKLISVLREGCAKPLQIDALVITQNKQGMYILSTGEGGRNSVVVDLHTADLFSGVSDRDVMVILQRLIRFCVKYWYKRPYSPSFEKIIKDSTKAIVFPFPFSARTNFRIAIEREPDRKRLSSRNYLGTFLLVFKAGVEEGQGPREEADMSAFRRAVEGLPEARKSALRISEEAPRSRGATAVDALVVTQLDHSVVGSGITPGMGFDAWQHHLTARQREFVQCALDKPHRLEGPAGSGKTLCLALKAIQLLREARAEGSQRRLLFVLHSETMRENAKSYFLSNLSENENFLDRNGDQSIVFQTLFSLSRDILKDDLQEGEFIEQDSEQAKLVQQLYVEEAIADIRRDVLPTYMSLISPELRTLLESDDTWAASELIAHEISVVIKGRCEEDLETYKKLPPLKYGLPVTTQGDKGILWHIFRDYNNKLLTHGQFDLDDIVISMIGQLDTPIWKRRRTKEGFDAILVDEAHLFNLNEFSVFHYLTKSVESFPIAFSIDRTQAIGDRGWELGAEVGSEVNLTDPGAKVKTTRLASVFRCSSYVRNLALSITASGATLFTNFEDPLQDVEEGLTEAEEAKARLPEFYSVDNMSGMFTGAYNRMLTMARDMAEPRCNLCVIFLSNDLLKEMRHFVDSGTKPFVQIRKRGDSEAIGIARSRNLFVYSHADFVGGLEFSGVLLVGVDKGRVPPLLPDESGRTSAFLKYSSLNRLYVAVTRARYVVDFLGEQQPGPSPLLDPAFANGFIRMSEG